MDSFWSSRSDAYLAVDGESRRMVVHPALRDIVKKLGPRRLLDYGCGDGSVFVGLDCSTLNEIVLFDTSQQMLARSRESAEMDTRAKVCEDIELLEGPFDCVILSLVLMTISSEEEQRYVFQQVRRLLSTRGEVLVAVTHPCFRDRRFSTFYTEFACGTPFDYFEEGRPFRVWLRSPVSGREVEFFDYHWTLETTVRLVTSVGMSLVEVRELSDMPVEQERDSTALAPPYVLLRFVG